MNPNKELEALRRKLIEFDNADKSTDEAALKAFQEVEAYITQSQHTAVREYSAKVKRGIIGSSVFQPLYANPNQEHAVNDARNTAVGLLDSHLSEYLER